MNDDTVVPFRPRAAPAPEPEPVTPPCLAASVSLQVIHNAGESGDLPVVRRVLLVVEYEDETVTEPIVYGEEATHEDVLRVLDTAFDVMTTPDEELERMQAVIGAVPTVANDDGVAP